MNDLRVVFMGTPDFCIPILEGLIDKCDVVGVVSQPDRKVGRKQILKPTPVKEVSLNNNIKVYQPSNIKTDYKYILDLNPDIIITCAYGQIIPKEVLDYPKYGCIKFMHHYFLSIGEELLYIEQSSMEIVKQVLLLCIWMLVWMMEIL